jgi:hypothetical protein
LAEIKGTAFPIDLKPLEYTKVSNRRGDKQYRDKILGGAEQVKGKHLQRVVGLF